MTSDASRAGSATPPTRLPPPAVANPTPRNLVRQLGGLVGEETAARWCADLLAGADPADYLAVLDYLASNGHAVVANPRAWAPYWIRTWGARGLLYVWNESESPVVVEGLTDEHWRPAEMCLKVSTAREVGEAGPGAEHLSSHPLPRVRAAAMRCLAVVGDTEHAGVVARAIHDSDPAVRGAAQRAWTAMADRLDLGFSAGDSD